MSCKVLTSQHNDYLRLDVSGEYTPGAEAEEATRFWAQAAATCREHKLTRVLAVFDVPGKMPTFAAFDVASNPPAINWDYRVKVALVYTHKDRFESNLFSETVAVNRGYQVKAIQDEPNAIAWLLNA
jgi:hypothetical protein